MFSSRTEDKWIMELQKGQTQRKYIFQKLFCLYFINYAMNSQTFGNTFLLCNGEKESAKNLWQCFIYDQNRQLKIVELSPFVIRHWTQHNNNLIPMKIKPNKSTEVSHEAESCSVGNHAANQTWLHCMGKLVWCLGYGPLGSFWLYFLYRTNHLHSRLISISVIFGL